MKAVLLSGIILREFGNNGKLGSGFKLHFYESQTDANKAVYTDVAGTIPATNPVICDVSGYPGAIYGKGLYRVLITDSFGMQVVPPIDGVGAESGADGDATYAACLNYDEVRALTADYDFAYVCGRDNVGDGGQGLFQRISDSEPDDDGIILTNSAGNVAWKRVFSGYIDPQWYGLKYDAILSQSAPLEKSMLASYRFHIPVRFTGSIYIDQSIEFVEGSAFVADEGAVVTSTYSNSILVSGESDIHGRFFGENVHAEFAARYSKINISWFGGQTDDARLIKLYESASTESQILVIDEVLNISSDINISQPITFEGGVINLASPALNLLLYEFIEPSYIGKIFNITATLAMINFGGKFILPEYFGAVGNNFNNDSAAFALAAKTGFVRVIDGKTYKLSTQMTLPVSLSIIGSATLSIGANNLNCTSLTLNECSVANTGTGEWFNGTFLFATNCVIPENYVVSSTKVISGCAYQGNPLYPVFDGDTGPAIYRAHLPLIKSAPGLATDEEGKIIKSGLNKLLHDGMVWRSQNSPTSYWAGDSNHNAPYRNSSGLAWANGRLWFLGVNGYLFSSVDGIHPWSINVGLNAGGTQSGLPSYNKLKYGGGLYLATTYRIDGTTVRGLMRSTNGVSWTPADFYDPAHVPGANSICEALYYDADNSMWIAGDYSGRVITSVDNGLTWTSVQIKYNNNGTPLDATGTTLFIGKIDGVYILTTHLGDVFTNTTFQSEGWTRALMGSACWIREVVKLDNGKYKLLGGYHPNAGSGVSSPLSFTVASLSQSNIQLAIFDQMPGFATLDQGYTFVTSTCHHNGVSFIGTTSYNTQLANQGQIYACPDDSNTWCIVPRIVDLSGYFSNAQFDSHYNSSFYLAAGLDKVFASTGAGQVLSTH